MSGHIALIGAGAKGGAIGARLVQTGSKLVVFDLDAAEVAALVALGAKAAPTAAAAARGARAVILSLNAARIVRLAVFGAGGVAEGAVPGTLIIDMSSIDPELTRSLAADAAEKGLRWVDSPLSGGIPKAATGELTLMQGGEADAVAAAQEVLAKVASNQTHMGSAGAGQTTKLINQVLCGLNFQAVAEATALAEAAGVDVARIPQALKGGRADSALPQEYMPRLPPHRADRQHGQGSECRAGSGPADPYRLAADRDLRRGAPDADRRRSGWRGSGGADGIFQGTKKGNIRMITRYALFEGSVTEGQDLAFRAAVLAEVLPTWKALPGALSVRVGFAEFRDEGAPEYPMFLAISYPDVVPVERALASPARTEAKAATDAVLARFSSGRIHHHVTTAHDHELA